MINMVEYVSPTIGEIGNGGDPGFLIVGPAILAVAWLLVAAHNMVGVTTIGVAGMIAAVPGPFN